MAQRNAMSFPTSRRTCMYFFVKKGPKNFTAPEKNSKMDKKVKEERKGQMSKDEEKGQKMDKEDKKFRCSSSSQFFSLNIFKCIFTLF